MKNGKVDPAEAVVAAGGGVEDQSFGQAADPPPKSSKLKDPFDPKTGIFRDNIRLPGDDDLTELREVMEFGWSDLFPAIVDENGVVLVGHRRLKAAKELGIEPIIKKRHFGSGPAADAERLKLALVSNIGGKPFTKDDRKRIAEYLYGEQEFTMSKIAEALQVSVNTVHHDLKGFFEIEKPPRPKGGRPKGAPKPTKEEKIVVDEGLKSEKPATPPPDNGEAAKERESARLKARIAELETEAKEQKTRIATLFADNNAMRRAASAAQGEIAQLKARIAELEAGLKTAKDETQRYARSSLGKPKTLLSEEDYKKLAKNVHPNRWDHLNNQELTKALNEAFQVVGGLFESTKKETRREAERRAQWQEDDLKWQAKKTAERHRREAAARKGAAKRKANKARAT